MNENKEKVNENENVEFGTMWTTIDNKTLFILRYSNVILRC